MMWCLCVCVTVTLLSHTLCSLSPVNEVPLRTTTWINQGQITPVHLNKGRTRRLHFTVRKRTTALKLTVIPCAGTVEWSLSANTLKNKPEHDLHWSFKKSEPEVWWRKSGEETRLHSYSGGAADVYEGPVYDSASIYTLRIKSTQQDTQADVHLFEGSGSSGVFPELPPDSRVHLLGVGMSSVTLTWNPSPSMVTPRRAGGRAYEYCVTVNQEQNYRSLCAARERDVCVCREVESVCTVSDLTPNTRYYFDVFVLDGVNGTSVAYMGTVAQTHAQSHTRVGVSTLEDGQAHRVTLTSGAEERRSFRFRPRGGQKNGLLSLQSCNSTHLLAHALSLTVSARGKRLSSQDVGDQLIQIWLQGSSSYRLDLQLRLASPHPNGVQSERVCVMLQASSAYHRQGAPALPPTLHIKSFNSLRTCSSVTLAWMGTEERGLYCLYRRREGKVGGVTRRKRRRNQADEGGVIRHEQTSTTDRCLAPESRPPSQRVLCKYFQELDARRAVTTATVGGLEAGTAYMFDVYLIRRWALPLKYHSKTVWTRREC